MVYRLRNFENNYQIIASLGWILIILSLIFLFVKKMPGVLIIGAVGVMLALWQARGKRVAVDTINKTVKKGLNTFEFTNPTKLYMNKVRLSQNVNSRVSSSKVHAYFYQAFIEADGQKIQISSNRKEDRDMQKLQAIAQDLRLELVKNY